MARTTFSGPVASQNGFIALSDNDKTIALTAPASLAANYTLTLPPNDGSNGQFLSTDGSGVLAWTAGDGTGTVTSVTISGGTTGLTTSGGPITTSGTITFAGTLAAANGGTGITSLGTGVATALGINVGSAGAPVVLDGALGTPSSGTVTNLTGTASINVNGTVGATTPAAGTFTDLTVNDKLIGAVQPLTGAGAVNLTDPITTITSTAADALTLANGTAGQLKYIVMIVDGGNATLTPTTMIGGTTITFDAVGDGCTLVYTSAGWAVVGISGAVVA